VHRQPWGQHPAPSHVIAHLSDPHLLAGRVRQYDAIDTEEHLAAALARLRRVDPAPQALVFTGDLADKGEPEAYARLRAIVEPAAADLGAEVVWVMGNHDEREAYSEALFGAASGEPQDRVRDVAGLRVVALDTTVPGWHHGDLTDDQLAWLADVLATPAEHGSVLALHHPPIPVPMLRAAEIIELHDQHRLAEVVTGTDVRAVIGGHFHYTSWSTFADGIPVSVASATCYTSDPAPDATRHLVTGVDADQAFTMLHLYPDRVVQTLVPVAEGPVVSSVDSALGTMAETMSAQERLEAVSRKDSPFNTGAPV
jgi:Icc protein